MVAAISHLDHTVRRIFAQLRQSFATVLIWSGKSASPPFARTVAPCWRKAEKRSSRSET